VSTQLFWIIKTKGCNRFKLPLLLERAGVRRIKIRQIFYFDPLILTFSREEKGLASF
jgi:hypothetical protein